MKTYTVFGVYCDNMQRHGDTVRAESPDDAERRYRKRMERRGQEMLVAAVVEGDVKAVDKFDDATRMGHV